MELIDVPNALGDLANIYKKLGDDYAGAHPAIIPNGEARVQIGWKTALAIDISKLNFQLKLVYLQKDYWATHHPYETDPEEKTREIFRMDKIAFLQLVFSSIEANLRAIYKAWKPSSSPATNFGTISQEITTFLGIKQYDETMKLYRLIRNSIHNNGLFFPHNNQNDTVVHNGNTYLFEVGKPINFATWDLIFSFLKEISQMTEQIINHHEFEKIKLMPDYFSTS